MDSIMTERWAMVLNNVVENIISWDGDLNTWQPPAGYTMVIAHSWIDTAVIGSIWNGTEFIPTPGPIDPPPE
jgi:hypothetical protein